MAPRSWRHFVLFRRLPQVSAPSNATRQKRILLAEDDDAIAVLLTRVLRQHYEVVHAADGARALDLARANPAPDLALLDVMMPDMDGFTVAANLRAIPALKQMPIIFLTARTASGDVIRGIQLGARHYIHKPFKIDDVLKKVKKALGD